MYHRKGGEINCKMFAYSAIKMNRRYQIKYSNIVEQLVCVYTEINPRINILFNMFQFVYLNSFIN